MEYARQTMSGNALRGVLNIPPTLYNRRVEVIILPLEDGGLDEPNYRCKVGIAKGAEVPDSFFEPLSEEDLQSWGL